MWLQLLSLSFLLAFSEWSIPDGFHYRRDYLVNSSFSGATSIRIQLEPDIVAASDARFFNPANGTWLDFFLESPDRVWITVSFSGSPVNISVFYLSLTEDGDPTPPPPQYGTDLTVGWISGGGGFVTMTTLSCSSPWADLSTDFSDPLRNRFSYFVPNGLGGTTVSGSFDNHQHSTVSQLLSIPADSSDVADVHEKWGPLNTHQHSLSGLSQTSGGIWPPYLEMVFCWSTELVYETGMVHMLSGNLTNFTNHSYQYFDPMENRFPRGKEVYGGVGGSTTHRHRLDGAVSQTAGVTMVDEGGASTKSHANHTHEIAQVFTTYASSLPSYVPTVFVESLVDDLSGSNFAEDSDSRLIHMVNTPPPIGFVALSEYEYVYAMGSPWHGSPIHPLAGSGVHYASVDSLEEILETDYSGSAGSILISEDQHVHPTSPYESIEDADPNDLDRGEMVAVVYCDSFLQDGITLGDLVQIRSLSLPARPTFEVDYPSVVGKCSGFYVVAVASIEEEVLVFEWRCSTHDGINSSVSVVHGPMLYLDFDVVGWVNLTVSAVDGEGWESQEVSISIFKSNYSLPSARIVGAADYGGASSMVTFAGDTTFVIEATYDVTCAGSSVVDYEYVWKRKNNDNSSLLFPVVFTGSNSRILRFPNGFPFENGPSFYEFEVTIVSEGGNSTASVLVDVRIRDLQAFINQSSATVPMGREIGLSGAGSSDPESSNYVAQYFWSCFVDCDGLLSDSLNGSSVETSFLPLHAQVDYEICLEYVKDSRNSTTCITLTSLDLDVYEYVPRVSIETPHKPYPASASEPLFLTARIEDSEFVQDVVFEWSCPSLGDLGNLILSLGVDSLSLVLKPGVLVDQLTMCQISATYTWEDEEANTTNNVTTWASVDILLNLAPRDGRIGVDPLSGGASHGFFLCVLSGLG